MPCSDVSEYLQIKLDAEDRLVELALAKNTCGAEVGGTVLLGFARGRTVEQLLAASLSEIVPRLEARRRVERFTLEKQLFALQAALAALVGQAGGALDDVFTIERLEYDERGGTTLSGLVDVGVVAEDVPGCKTCGTCSTP
ncbi:MAG: hypothetical protein KC503_44510 [Myxococcales bacterium]|nr:hypothetical protein [Myxococcales bacterium]